MTVTENITDRKLIDSIVYLSSLVSNPKTIEAKLDILRSVTSRLTPGGAAVLVEQERAALWGVQTELEEYLLTSDPVRSFTKESLEHKLASHLASADPQLRARRITRRQLFAIFGLSFVAYAIGMVLVPGSMTTKSMLAAPLFLVQLHAGLAWLFLTARKDLVAALRVAYGYIGAGLLASSLGSVQFPILLAYPALTEQPLFRYAGFMPLFPVMCLLFYVGLYIYARQLPEIKLRFLKPTWVAVAAIVTSLVVIMLPHAAKVPEEAFFDLSLVSTALSVLFSIPAALLGFAIVRHVTERYSQGIRLFASAQVAVALACTIFFFVLFANGPISGSKVSISALPFGISEGLMLIAAYLFKRNAIE